MEERVRMLLDYDARNWSISSCAGATLPRHILRLARAAVERRARLVHRGLRSNPRGGRLTV